MKLEGFGPSLRAPRHLNGPTIAAKMGGANSGDGGDHGYVNDYNDDDSGKRCTTYTSIILLGQLDHLYYLQYPSIYHA